MARVSRKKAMMENHSAPAVIPERVYHTAGYVRLSVEDNKRAGDKESIRMQQYMLEKYIAMQPDMQMEEIFCDNGETGTDFERPGFEAMMDRVRKREIDCIVVKDLSRFGRNYVEAGYYLEKIFPYLGVRFIAVNDHYDTLSDQGKDELVLSLKNLVNDLYAKDISQKISSAIAVKQKNGEYIGSVAPYGYRKSPEDKHQLIIDEEAALVVREIFQRRAEGQGIAQVARCLNERNIPCPALYKYKNGIVKKKPSGAGAVWQAQGVKALTRNMVYAGHMVQGKNRRSLSEGISPMNVPREEWIIVKNTHAPIVSQEIFDKVQEVTQTRRREWSTRQGKYASSENIFKGLIFCADCRIKMSRYKDASCTGRIRYGFHCRVYAENLDGQGCTRKWVGEAELKEAVLQGLQIQIELAADLKRVLEKLQEKSEYQKQRAEISQRIDQVQQKLKRNSLIRNSLFESFSERMLTEQEYLAMKAKYGKETEELKEELAFLENDRKQFECSLSPQNEWIQALQKCHGEKVITEKMVKEFIHRIWVYGYNHIEIIWNFQDEFIRIAKRIETLSKEENDRLSLKNRASQNWTTATKSSTGKLDVRAVEKEKALKSDQAEEVKMEGGGG